MTGTPSLKALAYAVLQRDAAWDSERDAIPKMEPGDHASVGQSGTPVWSAADWRVFYEERAAIAEHDGGLDRAEAECRTFEAAVVHWINSNPPAKPDPDKCAGCGGPVGHIGQDSVPVLSGKGEHVWVHHGCHHRLMARRYAEAIKALTAMGLTPPAGWRAWRRTEQKAHIARERNSATLENPLAGARRASKNALTTGVSDSSERRPGHG